ncbi:MAG: sensor histidine kinase [Proteobacteria bacterium]|nr:sensor histidine kinase [Pseudomonadota bacterium]
MLEIQHLNIKFFMSNKLKIGILATSIIFITLLHNISSMEGPLFLNIYQRLYYIPIVLAAYWFGLKGALITSIISTFSYPHHGHYHWPDKPFYTMNQYAEMMMFNLIGIVTGILSDLETRQRKKYEEASSELKEAYQKLQDSFEQVRRSDRLSALGELSAAMAHEIRNPLGSIKGGIEIIEEDFDKSSQKFEFIQIIKKEISRLDKKITEFLHYARPIPPQKRNSNINDIIYSVVRLVEKRAEQQGVKVVAELDEAMPETMMDSEQIKQALLNIILNGIQAIPASGVVTVKSWFENLTVCVSVRDTGKGIPKGEREKLFDPFFTTKEEGTGLGLSITYQILKAHGGDIIASEPKEGGGEFIVYLPKEEQQI